MQTGGRPPDYSHSREFPPFWVVRGSRDESGKLIILRARRCDQRLQKRRRLAPGQRVKFYTGQSPRVHFREIAFHTRADPISSSFQSEEKLLKQSCACTHPGVRPAGALRRRAALLHDGGADRAALELHVGCLVQDGLLEVAVLRGQRHRQQQTVACGPQK